MKNGEKLSPLQKQAQKTFEKVDKLHTEMKLFRKEMDKSLKECWQIIDKWEKN